MQVDSGVFCARLKKKSLSHVQVCYKVGEQERNKQIKNNFPKVFFLCVLNVAFLKCRSVNIFRNCNK